MRGYYLAADYYSGNFYKIIYNTGTSSWVVTSQTMGTLLSISDFGENEAGELFVTSNTAGGLYKVTSDGVVNTVYVFTGSGSWSNAANWAGGIVPPASLHNAIVVIKPRVGASCDLDITQTIYSDAQLIVERGELLNVASNLNLIK